MEYVIKFIFEMNFEVLSLCDVSPGKSAHSKWAILTTKKEDVEIFIHPSWMELAPMNYSSFANS